MAHAKHRSEDDYGIGDKPDGPAGLEWLRLWLESEFWNFDLGRHQFDGHSEGLCVLAGINPQESRRTKDQYGPEFLRGANTLYNVTSISEENQWRIKEDIDNFIDDLKSLGLRGRVHCHDAIMAAVDKNLSPPWLGAANDDFECAKRLPATLRTNNNIIERINRGASSKGGRNRAEKNAKTQIIEKQALQEFEDLKEKKFPDCRTKSSNKPIARKIADCIYHRLSQRSDVMDEHLPELPTLEKRVAKWLKNASGKS